MTKPKSAPPPKGKTSRPRVDWEQVRAQWEAGGPLATFGALAKRHSVSHTAIRKRSIAEAWVQSLEPTIQRRTDELVSGVVSTGNQAQRAAAIDEEATRRAEVGKRHRTEWTQVAGLRQEALAMRNLAADEEGLPPADKAKLRAIRSATALSRMKLAKLTAETTALQQAGERRAWRLGDDPNNPGEGDIATVRIIRQSSHDRDDDDTAGAEP